MSLGNIASAIADFTAAIGINLFYATTYLVPSWIESISPNSFRLLYDGSLSSMTAAQGRFVSLAQLNSLSKSQVRILSQDALSGLRGLVIAGYGHLDWFVTLKYLGVDTVSGLTRDQMKNLSCPQIQTLNAGGFSAAQLRYQTVDGWQVLEMLSSEQVTNLNTTTIRNLTVEQLQTFDCENHYIVSGLVSTQIAELTADQLSGINISLLKQISAAGLTIKQLAYQAANGQTVLENLSADQITKLLDSVIETLTVEQLRMVADGSPILVALTVKQIALLSGSIVAKLSSKEVLQQYGPGKQPFLSNLISSQIQNLSPSVISSLTGELLTLRHAGGSNVLEDLVPAQVSLLDATQLKDLSTAEILKINAAGLTIGQLRYQILDGIKLIQALTKPQLAALRLDVIRAFELEDLLSPIASGRLALQELSKVQVAALIPSQLAKMTERELSLININALTIDQLRAQAANGKQLLILLERRAPEFNVDAVKAMTATELNTETLGTALLNRLSKLQFQQLNGTVISAIDPKTLAIAADKISADQAANITPTQIRAFDEGDFPRMAADILANLSSPTTRALSAQQIRSLDQNRLNALVMYRGALLSADAGSGLSATQIGGLSPEAFERLSAEALSGMLPGSYEAVTGPQLNRITDPQQVQSIRKNFQSLSVPALQSMESKTWQYYLDQIPTISIDTLNKIEQNIIKSEGDSKIPMLSHDVIKRLSAEQVLGTGFLPIFLTNNDSFQESIQLIDNLNNSTSSVDFIKTAAITKVLSDLDRSVKEKIVSNQSLFGRLNRTVQLEIATATGFEGNAANYKQLLNQSLSPAVQTQFAATGTVMQTQLNSQGNLRPLIIDPIKMAKELDEMLLYAMKAEQTTGKFNEKLGQMNLNWFVFLRQSQTNLILQIDALKQNYDKDSADWIALDKQQQQIGDWPTNPKVINAMTVGRAVTLASALMNGITILVQYAKNKDKKDSKGAPLLDASQLAGGIGLLLNAMIPFATTALQSVRGVSFSDTVLGKWRQIGVRSVASAMKDSFGPQQYQNMRVNASGKDAPAALSLEKAQKSQAHVSLFVNLYNLGLATWALYRDIKADSPAGKGGKIAADVLGMSGGMLILVSNGIDAYIGGYAIAKSSGQMFRMSQTSKLLNTAGSLLSMAGNLTRLGIELDKIRKDESLKDSPNTRRLLLSYYGTQIALESLCTVAAFNPILGQVAAGVSTFTSTIFTLLLNPSLEVTTFKDEIIKIRAHQAEIAKQYDAAHLSWEAGLATYLSQNDLVVPNMASVGMSQFAEMYIKEQYYSLYIGLENWFEARTRLHDAGAVFSKNDLNIATAIIENVENFAAGSATDAKAGWATEVTVSAYGSAQTRTIDAAEGYLNAQFRILQDRRNAQATNWFNTATKSGGINSTDGTVYIYSGNFDASRNSIVGAEDLFVKMLTRAISSNAHQKMAQALGVTLQHDNVRFEAMAGQFSAMILDDSVHGNNDASNVVYFVASQDNFALSGDLSIATLSNSNSTTTTTDEIFTARDGFRAKDSITYVLQHNTVAGVKDLTETPAMFVDYSFHNDVEHFIQGGVEDAYMSQAEKNDALVNVAISYAYDPKLALDSMRKNNWNLLKPSNGSFSGSGDLSITELYKVGSLYGSANDGAYSILIGADMNLSDSANPEDGWYTEYLTANNSQTLVLAGTNSIVSGRSGGTLVGWRSASSTAFNIQGGNVDVYGFLGDDIDNNVNFQAYLSTSHDKTVIINDQMTISGSLQNARNSLMSKLGYNFDRNDAMSSWATYQVLVDGQIKSSGKIYNASIYKLGDQNANITLASTGAAVFFYDMQSDLDEKTRFSRYLTLNGDGQAVSLGYGSNSIKINGLGSNISFTGSLLASDQTAASAVYDITYATKLLSVDQLDDISNTSSLDLTGSTGKVKIDDMASINTTLSVVLDSRLSKSGAAQADVSLRQSNLSNYVIEDYFDIDNGSFNLSINPYVDRLNTIVNIYSDNDDLANASISARNTSARGFDLFVAEKKFGHIDFMNSSNDAVKIGGIDTGNILLNLQGKDTLSQLTTTRSHYVSF